jgi:hypothetical protein
VRNRELYAGLIVANVTRADYLAFPPETSVGNAFEALRRSVPQDLLLIGATGPVGTSARPPSAALRTGHDLDLLSQHAEHEFAVLQASGRSAPSSRSRPRNNVSFPSIPSTAHRRLDTSRIDEAVRLIRHTRAVGERDAKSRRER